MKDLTPRGNNSRKVTPTNMTETITESTPVQEAIDAAEVLIQYLPQDIVYEIKEAAESMQLPLWQMLLGYVVRCWDGKLLYAPFLLSSWDNGIKPSVNHRCEGCGKMFYSRFPDARFCCNPCAFDKLNQNGHSDSCQAVS